jgi:hypothetical protein
MEMLVRPPFRSHLFRRWLHVVAALALGACGMSAPGTSVVGSSPVSSTGAQGPGASGAASPSGGAQEARDDEAGKRARASQGLAISPVQPDMKGKTPREQTLIGLGSYIVNAASDCAGCHSGPAGFLSGGNRFFLGKDLLGDDQFVFARNLTPDPATGLTLTHDQFVEAIRTGRDFHAGATRMLVVMPWTTLRWSSDVDLDAIYAYLRAIPAVSNAVPADQKDGLPLPPSIPFDPTTYTDGDVTRPLRGANQSFSSHRGYAISPVVLDASTKGVHDDEGQGRSVGVGSYIANATAHCNDCHTHPDRTANGSKVNTASFLAGGTVFNTPPPLQPITGYVRATSANLEGATLGFFHEPGATYERFRAIIHTGTLVDAIPPRPLAFPMMLVAPNLARLLESDLRAVYDYAKAIPATTGASDLAHQEPARWCATDASCHGGETCTSGECTGAACTADVDCGTCQACQGGACQASDPASTCVLTAQ